MWKTCSWQYNYIVTTTLLLYGGRLCSPGCLKQPLPGSWTSLQRPTGLTLTDPQSFGDERRAAKCLSDTLLGVGIITKITFNLRIPSQHRSICLHQTQKNESRAVQSSQRARHLLMLCFILTILRVRAAEIPEWNNVMQHPYFRMDFSTVS